MFFFCAPALLIEADVDFSLSVCVSACVSAQKVKKLLTRN